MTILVEYNHFNDSIKSAKVQIATDVYQVIEPIVIESPDELVDDERYVKITYQDDNLSSTITKEYSQAEILELIRLLQRVTREIAITK